MATPSSVQSATTHNWLGSQAQYNLLKPEIDPREYMTFGEEDITGLMEIMGSKNPVKSVQYRHFEDDRLHTIVRATGTAAAANTLNIYTVDSAYTMTSFPATYDPYAGASFGSAAPNALGTTTLHPVRVGESILFPDGTRGTCTARTTTTFTVRPDVTGGVMPTVLNTENIILLGVVVGEGADVPLGVNLRENVYQNVLEINADSTLATGTSMGEQTWVNFEGKDGKMGFLWYFKQQRDTLRRFKNFRELHLVMHKKVDNVTTSGTGVYDATLLKTEGLYTFAASYNGATNYNIGAGLSLADFSTLVIDNIDANNGAKENTVMASIKLRDAIDGFIRPEMQAGAVQYNAFKGGKDQAVNFGYNGFLHLGYSFMLKTYDLLNNPTLLGSNTTFANSGLVLPMDKQAYSIGEAKRKESVGAFRMNYMSTDASNREMEEWLTGGTGGVFTNTLDNQQMNLRSHVGFEGFGAPRFNVLQGV